MNVKRSISSFFLLGSMMLSPAAVHAGNVHTGPDWTAGKRTHQGIPWDQANVVWPPNFDRSMGIPGTPGNKPDLWNNHTDTVTAWANMQLPLDSPFYATLTDAAPVNAESVAVSDPITCNVDLYNLIEIRVFNAYTASFWKMTLVSEGTEYELMPQDQGSALTGAPGTFTFNYAERLGWSGIKTFSIKLAVVRGTATPPLASAIIEVDYVCVFHDDQAKYYYWREDFSGRAHNLQSPPVWFGAAAHASDPNFAQFDYSSNPSQAKITTQSSWGKVDGPTIKINTQDYHHLALLVTKLDLGTRFFLNLYNRWDDAAGQDLKTHLGAHSQTDPEHFRQRTGTFVFDILQGDWNPNYPPVVNSVFPEIGVEGPVGCVMEIDSIIFYKDGLTFPNETAPNLNYEGYAAPNPFLPMRGQTTWFYLNERPGSSTVRIFNLKGHQVRTLANSLEWDGRDDEGAWCEGGLYLYQIEIPGKRKSGQVVLIK
jgi:hypothetical protein